jgi:serine/threonine-protein kinase
VSPELERIIDTCLSKKQEDRFATGGDLLAALERLPSSHVSHPPPASPPEDLELALARTRLADAPRATSPSTPGVATVTATSGARRPARRWLALAAIVGTLAVAAVAVIALTRRAPKVESPAAPLASAIALYITDAPAPKTANADAATAYAAALQELRDASVAMAYSSLARAVQLDPSLAAAHLRLVVQPRFGLALALDARREHVALASSLRATLTPRDQALLQVAEAMVASDTPNFAEVALRARAAADQFPNDAELVFTLGQLECEAGHTEDGYRTLDRALDLDPHFALPLWAKATCQSDAGARDGALASTARCLSISAGAASCLRVRAAIEDSRGACRELEKDARAMIAVEPRGTRAYEFLAFALAAENAPVASLRDTLRKRETLLPDETSKRWVTLEDEAHVATLTGAFADAIKTTTELLYLRDAESNEKAHGDNAELFLLYEETARGAKALSAARDYANRLPAWTQDAPERARPFVLAIRHRAGDIVGREYDATRDAWLEAARTNYPPKSANLVWLDFYARPARTRAEAQEALAALPRFSPLPAYQGSIVHEEAIGRVYLLAGRFDEAIEHLRVGAKACSVLATPIPAVRAHAELGEALEAKGATEEACREYGAVLGRWGHTHPRSATADRAKARFAALHCATH